MNRISDNSKDSIIRELKALFESNSTTVTSHILKDNLAVLCGNKIQVLSFVPLYAAIVASLHFVVGLEVGAFLIEYFVVELISMVNKERENPSDEPSKVACNYLLLVLYLYNYRIIHHVLVVDILNYLVSNASASSLTALDIELISLIIDHAGINIRSDDPLSLKASIVSLTKLSSSLTSGESKSSLVENGRVKFLLEMITDLKNNKTRKSQNANAETVKTYRKWLGSVKTTLSSKPGNLALRVALQDLLDAEKRGRWWKAGATWAGADNNDTNNNENSATSLFKKSSDSSSATSAEEKKLLKLADKLRMTTPTRKNVFLLLMSSNDVNDAYEKLARLDLKGKQDRDIVKVLCECCAQEKVYNEFYAELACMLCKDNRQFKTTFQFTFWDIFKTIDDEGEKERRAINVGRLLARLVAAFHLPLSVIKPIDMSDIGDMLQVLLAAFFVALFTADVSFNIIVLSYIYIYARIYLSI